MVSMNEGFSEQVLIKRLKADGTYDILRKSCLQMVEENPIYTTLRNDLDLQVSKSVKLIIARECTLLIDFLTSRHGNHPSERKI